MYFWRVSLFVIAPYAFLVTATMGMLARKRELVIAVAACLTISTTAVITELYKARNATSQAIFWGLEAWTAMFFVSAVFAALALPLARMRITNRR